MAKLLLLLVLACFQFSRPEELPGVKPEDEIPFNDQTAPNNELSQLDFNMNDEVPFNDQTAPNNELSQLDFNMDDEVPFNDQTAPSSELAPLDINPEDEIPFNDQTAPEDAPMKLGLNRNEIPFNDQTAPGNAALAAADDDQWYDYDYKEIIGDVADNYYEELFNQTQDYLKQTDKTAKGKGSASKNPYAYPAGWQVPGSYYDYYDWGNYKSPDYITEDTNVVINKNGKKYTYNTVSTLMKLNDLKNGKAGQGWNAGMMGQGWNTGKMGQSWGTGKMGQSWGTGKMGQGWNAGKMGQSWNAPQGQKWGKEKSKVSKRFTSV